MSIAQKIRGLFGQQLLQNTAGFKVVRGTGNVGPWVKEGESLALIPEGIQEVQFPMEAMGSDSIVAQVQVAVVFVYNEVSAKCFNFAYNVVTSQFTGNFVDVTKKAVMNIAAPKVSVAFRELAIADMVKETTFPVFECEGIVIKSVSLSVKPKDSQVMAALGADKTEELVRLANIARQETRKQAIENTAELRTAEYEESLAAIEEQARVIDEQAKNQLAEAEATAAAQAKIAEQQAKSAQDMVAAFGNDSMAYALYQLANSGGDITITSELLAAFRGGR